MITRETIGKQLRAYLNSELSFAQLVDWTETAMVDDEMEEGYDRMLFDMLARIGVADVKEFELSWQDIVDMLDKLGYRANVALTAA
ncbi:MAG: hypothetical protein IT331_18660 [Anaerolineae bacterium]|nr:hypothetical protein [Anaerolineae bacterium]